MKKHLYKLDKNGTPVPASYKEWAEWVKTYADNCDLRRVGFDVVGDHHISTVFLGVDHGLSHGGPPVLWETMVFKRLDSGNLDTSGVYQSRCCGTKEQAEAMHNEVVQLVKQKKLKEQR